MTKVAIVTDLHFGGRGDSIAFQKYQRRFFDEVFFPEIDRRGIGTVLDLGDTFDRRRFINFNSLSASHDMFFRPMADRKIDFHAIIGNHDTYYRNNNDLNSMELLVNHYDNITLYYDKPQVVEFDGLEILMTPWIAKENFDVSLEEIENTSAQVLFGHLELDGFEMYRGQNMRGGMPRSHFNKFDVVASGHFHHKSTQGNIHYLGNSFEMTWNDYNDPRGFHIFDTETREFEFIQNPFKLFKKIWYDDSNLTVDEISKNDFEEYTDCFVKVIVQNKTNLYGFDLFMDKLTQAAPAQVNVVDDHKNLNEQSEEEIVNEAEDTLTILTKFVENLDTKADKGQLNSLLTELYNEAHTLDYDNF